MTLNDPERKEMREWTEQNLRCGDISKRYATRVLALLDMVEERGRLNNLLNNENDALIAKLQAHTQGGWISVEQRMPRVGQLCLVVWDGLCATDCLSIGRNWIRL